MTKMACTDMDTTDAESAMSSMLSQGGKASIEDGSHNLHTLYFSNSENQLTFEKVIMTMHF